MTGVALSVKKYSAYTKYKNSGIEWLGEVPIDWSISRLKFITSIFGRIGFRGYTTADIVDEGEGALVLSPSNVFDGKLDLDSRAYLSWEKYYESPEIIVEPDDILLVKTGSTYGKSAIVDDNSEPMTINPQMALLKQSKIPAKYLAYVMSSDLIKAIIEVSNTGSGMPTMTQENINSFPIPMPCQGGAESIANFLDHETAKIDTLIAKQEKLIELLKEKRQAVISHAVTRGLNPDAPMKDSGVEWLGEVPEHWEVKRLKYIGQAKNGLTYSPDNVVDKGEGTLVLRSSNIQDAKLCFTDNVYVRMDIPERIRTKENDLLICSRNGSRKLIGKNALITKDAVGTAFGAFMVLYRSKINPYLYWVFNSPLFEYQSGSFLTSTINQLTIGNLDSMEIPLPPESEQNEIRSYLVNKDNYFNKLMKKSKAKVLLLKERKTALISAAVTGKIDVRNWQTSEVEAR